LSEHPFLAIIDYPVEDQLHGYHTVWVFARGRLSNDIEERGTPNRRLELGMEEAMFHLYDVLMAA